MNHESSLLIIVIVVGIGFFFSVILPSIEETEQKSNYSEVRSFLNITIGNNTSIYEKINIIEHACIYSSYPTNSCIRAMDEVYLP